MVAQDQGLEALYPFLYGPEREVAPVLEQARRSTVEKAEDIVALRREVVERSAVLPAQCAEAMAGSFAAGGKLLSFGNGGSSTDAQEVSRVFRDPAGGRRRLPALCLTADIAAVTALTNDIGFDVVFARQIAALGRRGDIAVGLSTSGSSENLIRAFDEASLRGLLTVGLAGYEGEKMAEVETIDYLFVVPSSSVHRIQEAQTTIYHTLWELTHRQLEHLQAT